MKEIPHILLVGPLVNKKASNLGGATVSFSHMVDDFKNRSPKLSVVNTQRFDGYLAKPFNLLYTLLRYHWLLTRSEIVFLNLSQGGMIQVAPYLVKKAFNRGKKIALRPFGGAMDLHFEKYSEKQRKVFLRMISRVNIFYLQTKYLISHFKEFHENIKQLPTSRPDLKIGERKKYTKKLLYVGQIKASKGIDEILMLINELDESFTLDIYGPIMEKKYRFLYKEAYYKGVVNDQEIASVLRQYDVLVFPTFYQGEGYPGVIIEAFRSGMPVITTKWRSIVELVNDQQEGMLVNVKSTDELLQAIRELGQSEVDRMGKNARTKYESQFQSEMVLGRVYNELINEES